MKKQIYLLNLFILAFFLFVQPAFAQTASTTSTGDVSQIQNFIQSIIGVLTTLASLVAVVFFVLGGFGYITSSGNPEHLERSKKTILYSGIGLAVTLGAFVLSHIVTNLAQSAFGK